MSAGVQSRLDSRGEYIKTELNCGYYNSIFEIKFDMKSVYTLDVVSSPPAFISA